MATEILRPQDCLTERVRVSSCRRRSYQYQYQYHGHSGGNVASAFNYGNNYYSNSTSSFNQRINRKAAAASGGNRSEQKKRHHQPEPSISKRSTSADDLRISRSQSQTSHHSHGLVIDKVTILRRGESFDSRIAAGGEAATTSSERIGSVPRQVRVADGKPPPHHADVYAGSAFAVSPSPSALPLPSFSKKKQVSVDDSATRDLRRLLRLDL
ncbi:hypothetical protein LINPERPRIM_LOCUS18528 [Linum perenne]